MKQRRRPYWGVGLAGMLCALGLGLPGRADTVALTALDMTFALSEGKPARSNTSLDGRALTINGKTFTNGIGVHAKSVILLDLGGKATRFAATVGVDDEPASKPGTVEFVVVGDGKGLWRSGVMRKGQSATNVSVKVKGVKRLELRVTDGGDGTGGDHANWAEARVECQGAAPRIVDTVVLSILTPPPGPAPRITGAKVFGVRHGSPFLFTVTATGDKPCTFKATGLPAGLTLDAKSGMITGVLTNQGEHVVQLRVSNAKGKAERAFKIVVGEQLALTPPMGWNSWNCWAGSVDADKVLRSARAMKAFGLADHGWTYINIDDTWQAERTGKDYALQSNAKFPDMKGLCDAIHAMGFKAGIYSTPWRVSYAQHAGGSSDYPDGVGTNDRHRTFGKYSFEVPDSRQWVEWGFDYLKYDWNPITLAETEAMAKALRACGRDMVYSLSNAADQDKGDQYARLSNCWRTTGDIVDTWDSMSWIWDQQDGWRRFAGPGHWNDPDMLVVGYVGWGPNLHPTRLTPDEQFTHISLWSLLAAPLLLGCDVERLDEFTLSLLSNDDVLDVNQDPLGRQAARIRTGDAGEVWMKDLEDGSRAVGLFNRANETRRVSVTWTELGLSGGQRVRDLWRQKELGTMPDGFEVDVPSHGVVLLKLAK